MPPRYAYWTILIDGKATAFRSRERDELLPTFNQLARKNANIVMRYFARGRLWDSPEQAQWASRNPPVDKTRERRGRDWRPGGEHRDPRDRFGKPKERRPKPPGASADARRPKPPAHFDRPRPSSGSDQQKPPGQFDRPKSPGEFDRQKPRRRFDKPKFSPGAFDRPKSESRFAGPKPTNRPGRFDRRRNPHAPNRRKPR